MELRDYLALLGRWWWAIILSVGIGAAAGFLLTPTPAPVYAATTTVLLNQGNSSLPDLNSVRTGQQLSNTYGELLRTRSVMQQVIANLNLDMNPDALANRIRVTNIEETNLLEIRVTASDPQLAADIANEVVAVFIADRQASESARFNESLSEIEGDIAAVEQQIEEKQQQLFQVESDIRDTEASIAALDSREAEGTISQSEREQRDQLETQLASLQTQRSQLDLELRQLQTRYSTLLTSFEELRRSAVQNNDFMSVVEEALPGGLVSSRPRRATNALQGALAGAVIAGGLVLLAEQLRVSVNSAEEVERITNLHTLGMISEIKGSSPSERLITIRQPRSPISEAYRALRTSVEFATGGQFAETLVVTSSGPSEGKTTTAANLAITVAQSGKRVVLVDTDLRRPNLHKLFGTSNTRGVTTALLQQGERNLSDHMIETEVDGLHLMPSGPLPPNPADLLGSPELVELINHMKQEMDYVIFDSAPLLAVVDPILIARHCEAALMVVKSNTTRSDALRKSTDQMKQSNANLIGVVLNQMTGNQNGYYYYYGSRE